MKKLTQLITEARSDYMSEAIKLAKLSIERGGGPFGCVIVKEGVIIGKGYNKVTMINDPTAHAEIMAIRDACQNLKTFQLTGCEIYTTCYPCPMCLGAIYWARPAIIYYGATHQEAHDAGFDDQFIYDELAKPDETKRIPLIQLKHTDASFVFKKWSNKDNKIEY